MLRGGLFIAVVTAFGVGSSAADAATVSLVGGTLSIVDQPGLSASGSVAARSYLGHCAVQPAVCVDQPRQLAAGPGCRDAVAFLFPPGSPRFLECPGAVSALVAQLGDGVDNLDADLPSADVRVDLGDGNDAVRGTGRSWTVPSRSGQR